MKFEFGIMSQRWEIEAIDLKTAKLCMCLFYEKNIPIAIYSPEEVKEAFMPKDFLETGKPSDYNGEEVKKSMVTIKDLMNIEGDKPSSKQENSK
jgi:predicted nucleotidyltransferase